MAKRYFGNRHFSTIKLQGVVVSSTDGKMKPDNRAQWKLNVLQHPVTGSVPGLALGDTTTKFVINAGDGVGEHPHRHHWMCLPSGMS